MKKYNCDVLFIVEHKSRELATYKRIAKLLSKNGISSLIIQKFYYAHIIPFISPSVVIGNGFASASVSNLISKELFSKKSTFIIHLWEQLIVPYNEDLLFRKRTDFETNECITLYWHDDFKRILREKNYDMDKSYYVNNPNLSLLNGMADKKEQFDVQLREEFNLKGKKILFYPSMFFWAFFYHENNPTSVQLHKFFSKQLDQTKVFIEEVLKEDDTIVVFRPHPYETKKQYESFFSKEMFEHKNFIFTYEHTVKEWTLVSDYIISNFSTTVYDAYLFGKKACFFKVDEYLDFCDQTWLHVPPYISSYKDFVNFKNIEVEKKINLNEIDFHVRFSEIIMENIRLEKYSIPFIKRIKMLLKKDVLKAFIRSILCKYFNGYKIDDSIKPDYFEPVIIEP